MSVLRACVAAAALLLGVGATPAWAEGAITSPGAGTVVRADAVLPLRATADGPAELSLLAPGAATAEVVAATAEGGELAHDFDTACATAVCTEPAPAANGTWTLRLSGAGEDERTFVVRIAPAVPADVAAALSEGGVTVRWRQGDEPDLRGWRVETPQGRIVRDGIGPAACDAERTCSVEVPEDAGSWTVRAFRKACPDCRESLASAASAAVRVPGQEPAAPAGTGAGTGAGAGTGSGAGAGAGAGPTPSTAPAPPPARRPDQRDAFLGAFGAGRPVAPAAPPPLPVNRLPALPQSSGTFAPELGYAEQELVVREPSAPLPRAAAAVGSALGTGERIRMLVLALLLVGAALWLRRWARRVITE